MLASSEDWFMWKMMIVAAIHQGFIEESNPKEVEESDLRKVKERN